MRQRPWGEEANGCPFALVPWLGKAASSQLVLPLKKKKSQGAQIKKKKNCMSFAQICISGSLRLDSKYDYISDSTLRTLEM